MYVDDILYAKSYLKIGGYVLKPQPLKLATFFSETQCTSINQHNHNLKQSLVAIVNITGHNPKLYCV